MFKLFKNKIELKNTRALMSSEVYQKGVKIGTEIIVPKSFKCLIYNNNKYFLTLPEGNHTVTNDNFGNIITSQSYKGKKAKRVRMIAHFVNISNQKLEIKLGNRNYLIEFCVNNPLQFAELMLLYTYKVDNVYCYSYLNEIFKDLLLYHNKNTSNINNNALEQYGINIVCLSSNNKSNRQSTSILESTNIKQNTKNTEVNTQSNSQQQNNKQSSGLSCPNCGNIMKFAVSYCLRCGHKLN